MTIKVRNEVVDLFSGIENLSIFHISDIHVWYSNKSLRAIDVLISRRCPDLILMTGDYFDFPKGAKIFRDFLIRLSARYPIAFIRGNHDFLYGKRISDLMLNIPNCHCVEKSIFCYKSKKGLLYNITSYENRCEAILKKEGKNILLIHNPERISEKELHGIQLILAGHLHGGQCIFYRQKNGSFFPGSLLYKLCTDRKEFESTKTILIVSKGVSDTMPIRFNCQREIPNIIVR